MNDKDYRLEFHRIINKIAELVEKYDLAGEIDVDLNGEILNISTNKGVFVINKQPSLQEIWLSSPVSGPYHFSCKKGNKWFSRSGDELFKVLSQDLEMNIIDN